MSFIICRLFFLFCEFFNGNNLLLIHSFLILLMYINASEILIFSFLSILRLEFFNITSVAFCIC